MVNANTEIRQLSIAEFTSLARSLSPESWKILMGSIKISESKNIPRFTSEDVRLIEEAGKNQQRPAAEVFLAEWSTMGKTRPTVGSLMQLLTETNLLRAADYLAVDILKDSPPERPQEGPAAAVDLSKILEELSPPEPNSSTNDEKSELWNRSTAEADLNHINYPSQISSTSDSRPDGAIGVIEMNFIEDHLKNAEDFPRRSPQEISDFIKFSKTADGIKDQTTDLIKFSSNIIKDEVSGGSGPVVEATNLLPSLSLLNIKPYQKNGDSSESSFYTETTSSMDFSRGMVSTTDSQTVSMQSSDFNLPVMSEILPDGLKSKNGESEGESEEVDTSVISENVQDLPVTILEFFKR